MDIFVVSMIGVIVFSILVVLFTYSRVHKYNSQYHLQEDKYTKLFGIFTKEHIAIMYGVAILANSIIAIFLIMRI